MKEQELDELVKRLEAHKPPPYELEYGGRYPDAKGPLINPDGPAAAAAIQSLREQVKGLPEWKDFVRLEIPGLTFHGDDCTEARMTVGAYEKLRALKALEQPTQPLSLWKDPT